MKRTTRIVVAAAGGTLGLGLAAPLAAMADTAPPTGTASGTGLSVGAGGQPLVAVSPTSASAGSGGSQAAADTVQVGGQNVLPGGSSENGSTTASGSALSTPSGSPVDASVAQYQASSGRGTAEGQARLAHAAAGGPSGVSANLVQSDSKATYGSSQSTGDGSTDGAVINAGGPGGLTLDVLHSESHSLTGAGSYVLGVNGTDIGTSQDVGQICSALSNPLLALACVTAAGGNGSFLAQVANADLPGSGAGTSGLGLLLLAATGSGNAGATPAGLVSGTVGPAGSSTATTVGLPVVPAGPATALPASSTGSGGGLPFTGAPVEFYVLVSGALLALGGVIWKLSTTVRPAFLH